jgi:flavin reductase (DIM6/NTAB) family NADH-FMN oxidoreductase RutF/DNA-binding IclR family transcriptional regulator
VTEIDAGSIDPKHFRRVLGHFPTGVAVITGIDADGKPGGLAIGSFSSVSLDPPLVAFMPDKNSSTWPRLRDSGHFCVNILGSDQEEVCRTFAVSGGDKFADLTWKAAGSGSPILDGVLAWIDCDLDVVHEAGDHDIVIGRVRELEVSGTTLPLVFFQGGYGRFSSLSLAAWESDLALQMRSADLARPHMEAVAAELDIECVASAVVGPDMVLLARAGNLPTGSLPTAVGQRIPFEPPVGTAFVAWAPASAQRAWLSRLGKDVAPEHLEALDRTLAEVREAGYSVGRGHRWHEQAAQVMARPDPTIDQDEATAQLHELIGMLPPDYESPAGAGVDARTVSTPVFGPGGGVVMVLSGVLTRMADVGGEESPLSNLAFTVARLRAAAAAVTEALHGAAPEGV